MVDSMIYQIINSNIIIFYFFVFFIGACFASFFNVYALRYLKIVDKENATDVFNWFEELKLSVPDVIKKKMDQNVSLSYPASHCYACKTPLKWYHNIPIISWLFLKGKCGFCGAKISIQYPIVEFFGGVLALACAYVFYSNHVNTDQEVMFVFLAMTFFAFTTYLLLVIDWKTMYLPDELNYVLLWAGMLFIIFNVNPFGITLKEAVLASVASYMFFWILAFLGKKIKGYDVMGMGDLKLVAAMAPFLGLSGIFATIFLSPFFGIFFWFLNKNKQEPFPYGPSLILAAWVNIYMLAYHKKDLLKWITAI